MTPTGTHACVCLGHVKPVSQVASHRGWALGSWCATSSLRVLIDRMPALGLRAAGCPRPTRCSWRPMEEGCQDRTGRERWDGERTFGPGPWPGPPGTELWLPEALCASPELPSSGRAGRAHVGAALAQRPVLRFCFS